MIIQETVKKIISGEITAEENLDFYLTNAKNKKDLNAFINLLEKSARKKALEIDKKIKQGKKTGKLAGVVIAVKDIINIEDEITTCGSKILEKFKSPYNATVIEQLNQEDAIIIGKTNLDEFAMGSSTENSYFGVTRNPFDESRVPGGSSGGSAVAVAADMAQASLGSDTGGSIRQPAAFTGVVGLKPSYGRVSRYGLVAYASSLDQIGTFSKNVSDSAFLLQIIAGYDQKDSTSANIGVPDYNTFLNRDVKGLRIGIPDEYFSQGLEELIKKRIFSVINQLKSSGAEIKGISLPHSDYAIAAYYLIAMAEASSNLARYDSVRYGYRNKEQTDLISTYKETRHQGFGEEVKRRIMLGSYVLSAGYYDAYYKKAQQVRRLIKDDFDRVFQEVDCIITPTTPTTAFKIGEKIDDPLSMYLMDIYTVTANLTGIGGINIPVGYNNNRLPIGLQILTDQFKEENLFRLGDFIERECNF
jgi:aspartyl-tRNA(Asn)/glutamyl-tRNA(Gln) amidotransferase subunit A